jgi:predicted DNA-binding transcriptional regulator AlpA
MVDESAAFEKLLTAKDVAEMLQMSEFWVYQHANGSRRPYLKRIKLGKAVRFRREDVLALVRAAEDEPGASRK